MRFNYTEVKQTESQQQPEEIELECVTDHDTSSETINECNFDNGLNLTCADGFKVRGKRDIKCWLWTLIFWIWIIIQITCTIIHNHTMNTQCTSICNAFYPCPYCIITYSIFALFYLCYIIETCRSSTCKYLWNHNKGNNQMAQQILHDIKNAHAGTCWKAEWFHMYPEISEVGYNQEVTHTEISAFKCLLCVNKTYGNDNVEQIIDVLHTRHAPYDVARVTFSIKVRMANERTEEEYCKQYDQFTTDFRTSQKNIDKCGFSTFTTYHELGNLYTSNPFIGHMANWNDEILTVYIDKQTWEAPAFLDIKYYFLAALLLVLPCYKMWLTTVIGDSKYETIKCEFIKELNCIVDVELLVHAFFRWSGKKQNSVQYVPTQLAKLIGKYCPELQ
eukprot:9212_1